MTDKSRKPNLRQSAARVAKNIHETRWLSLKHGYLSLRGLSWRAICILLNALLLCFVLPALPGITFTGGLPTALVGALILVPVTLVTNLILGFIFETALRLLALGEMFAAGFLLVLFTLGAPGDQPIKLVVLATLTGSLAVHGPVNWILATIVMMAAFSLSSKLFDKLWPCSLTLRPKAGAPR